MIPSKPNKLFKEIAEELDISEDLVDKFITLYYKEIRRHLSELNYTRINIDGLGKMVIKPKTVNKLIDKHSARIENINTYSFQGHYNKKRLEARLEDLKKIKVQIDEQSEKKKDFLKVKYGSEKNLDK